MQRRRFITLASVGLLSVTASGCITDMDGALVDIAPVDTDATANADDTDTEETSPILYADLPRAEQEIVQTGFNQYF
jgi:hypothetical protein